MEFGHLEKYLLRYARIESFYLSKRIYLDLTKAFDSAISLRAALKRIGVILDKFMRITQTLKCNCQFDLLKESCSSHHRNNAETFVCVATLILMLLYHGMMRDISRRSSFFRERNNKSPLCAVCCCLFPYVLLQMITATYVTRMEI